MKKLILDTLVQKPNSLFTFQGWRLVFFFFLAKLRSLEYNSFAGFFWTQINPLIMTLIMFVVFHKNLGASIEVYPLYLLTGVVCVNYFSLATNNISATFHNSRDIVLNSTIPRESIILLDLFLYSYKFVIELALCLVFAVFFKVFSMKIFLIFPILLFFFLFVLSIGIIVAVANCFASDIRHIWGVITKLLLFATPIFYDINSLSPVVKHCVYFFNPLTPFVLAIRSLFTGPVDYVSYVLSAAISVVFASIGIYIFVLLQHKAIERA